MRILVTGGTRSGKSAHAEALLADRPAVTYLATAPARPGDAAWTERIRAHRDRRPAHWTTRETTDLGALAGGPVLLDSLGSWLTAQLDDLGAWDGEDRRAGYEERAALAVQTIAAAEDLVIVSEEVGLGGIGAHPTARLFADLLGELNQRVAAVCDEVHLVVAGRALRL